MMITIFSAGLIHETLYLEGITEQVTLDNFREAYFKKGMAGFHGNPPSYWAIANQIWYELANSDGYTYFESIVTGAVPSAPLNIRDYNYVKQMILTDLNCQNQEGKVDIVLLNLHGAMMTKDCLDCEGDILHAVRHIVHEDSIIAVILDPHAHITSAMLENADIIMCYREYPYTDIAEVATQLYKIAVKAAKKEISPKMISFDSHMITQLMTKHDPMKTIISKMREYEGDRGIEAITICHSFPWGDNESIGVKTIAIVDAKQPVSISLGGKLTEAVGLILYTTRNETKPNCVPLSDVITRLNKDHDAKKPFVLADYADNPGAGGHGRSTFILHEIFNFFTAGNSRYRFAFSSLWDPTAVEHLMTTDIGETARITLGGTTDKNILKYDGHPLDVEVEIIGKVKDFNQNFDDSLWSSGNLVGLRIMKFFAGDKVISIRGQVELVVNSIRVQTFTPDCFAAVNISIEDKDILIVKSMFHYIREFSKIAEIFILLKTSGVSNSDIRAIHYKNLPKKEIWPLVEKVSVLETILGNCQNEIYNELYASLRLPSSARKHL